MDYLKSFGVDVGQGKYDEEIAYSLALIYNLYYNEVSAYLQSFNLTPAKLNALMIIKHRSQAQGISQVDMSKYLIVTPSSMTRLIDNLEKEKLVTRSAQKADRRVNLIGITAKGSNLIDKVWPGYLTILKKMAVPLKKGDQKNLSSLLLGWLSRLPER